MEGGRREKGGRQSEVCESGSGRWVYISMLL